jgi:hypothetical protein
MGTARSASLHVHYPLCDSLRDHVARAKFGQGPELEYCKCYHKFSAGLLRLAPGSSRVHQDWKSM